MRAAIFFGMHQSAQRTNLFSTQEQYTGAEKRAALEICVIRDSLESLGGKARWVPHDRNPADCLSKLKGNVESLLKMMRSGTY